MRESRPYGSVRGDRGNPVPYRDHLHVVQLRTVLVVTPRSSIRRVHRVRQRPTGLRLKVAKEADVASCIRSCIVAAWARTSAKAVIAAVVSYSGRAIAAASRVRASPSARRAARISGR